MKTSIVKIHQTSHWIGFILIVFLPLNACVSNTMTVTIEREPYVSFMGLKTYAWKARKPTGDPRIDNNEVHARITQAVDKELKSKGYALAKSSEADFLVTYYATLDKIVKSALVDYYHGYPKNWEAGKDIGHDIGTSKFVPQNPSFEYDKGTLVLDIVDPEGRRRVWRGSATDKVNLSAHLDERRAKINDAVKLIFQNLPFSST